MPSLPPAPPWCPAGRLCRVARVWVWDEERSGAYCLEAGELIHAPYDPERGRFDWDSVAAVDWFALEPEHRPQAERALELLEDATEWQEVT